MKKNLAYVLLVMLISVASCSFTNKSFENDDKDKLLLELITYVLGKVHYEPKDINDDFSVNIYESFVDIIDPTKRYFLTSDIEEFERQKFQIDDQIQNNDITFFNLVHERLIQRMHEAQGIYKEVLNTPFDYTIDETINIKYDEMEFVDSKKDLKERWRLQLKYATLGTYDSKLSHLNEDAEIAKEHGHSSAFYKEDTSEAPTSIKGAETTARETTLKTLDDYFDFIDGDMQRKDWFVPAPWPVPPFVAALLKAGELYGS